MGKFLNIISIFALLGLFVSCEEINIEDSILPPYSTPSGQATTKWSTGALPLEVHISDSYTADEATIIETMGENWEIGSGKEGNPLDFFDFSFGGYDNREYPTLDEFYRESGANIELGIYKSSNWNWGLSSRTLGVTQYIGYWKNVGTSAEHIQITHADIIINDRDFNFTIDMAQDRADHPGTVYFDLASVVLHELGHFIGLDHYYSSPSVMAPSLSSSTEIRDLYEVDKDQIMNLYGLRALSADSEGHFMAIQAIGIENEHEEGEPVIGIIEMSSNGHCNHKIY